MGGPFAALKALVVRERRALRTCAFWTASFVMLLSFSACGDDATAPEQLEDATATRAGSNGNQAMSAQPDASSVNLAGAVSPPLACGPSECMRPKNIAADLLMSVTGLPMTGAETVACCLDEAEGICSSAASVGAACDTVAVSDNRCPGVDLSALADLVGGLVDSTRDAMIGCCTHGACGLDGKIFGRGCVENAEAKRMLSVVPVIGPLINVPPPRACDEGEAGPSERADNDAGM